ncbi:unnamed protein product, partial [Darwinula stevensoni]
MTSDQLSVAAEKVLRDDGASAGENLATVGRMLRTSGRTLPQDKVTSLIQKAQAQLSLNGADGTAARLRNAVRNMAAAMPDPSQWTSASVDRMGSMVLLLDRDQLLNVTKENQQKM